MKHKINLSDYFQRIGYTQSAKADLETLAELQKSHLNTIPFESINPLLGLAVDLDLKALEQKLIYDRRGGYCFEQNLYFLHVLKQLGFTARGLTGRVIIRKPLSHITPRSHMLVLVELDGKEYICDVGFGGQTVSGPLLLNIEHPQKTPHEDYRILQVEKGYLMQAKIKEEWVNLYVFDKNTQYLIDYQVANWYTSTHPNSHFTKTLIAAKTGEKCRYNLQNNELTIHYLNKNSEKMVLQNPEEILNCLQDIFNLDLSNLPSLLPRIREVLE